MYSMWLIFSYNLVNMLLPVYFLKMWLSGLIVITNSNGESEHTFQDFHLS